MKCSAGMQPVCKKPHSRVCFRWLAGSVLFLVFWTGRCLSEEPFGMTTDGRHLTIRTRAFEAFFKHDSFLFRMETEHGRISTNLKRSSQFGPEEVVVETLSPDRIRARFVSKELDKREMNYAVPTRFLMEVEIRRGDGCLYVRSGFRNMGRLPARILFFWMFAPMRSDVYVLPDGPFPVKDNRLLKDRWVFLPHENHYGGMGLLFDHAKENLSFKTNYPDNSGWYLYGNSHPGIQEILPGEINRVDFVIFPALNEREVGVKAAAIRAGGFFGRAFAGAEEGVSAGADQPAANAEAE